MSQEHSADLLADYGREIGCEITMGSLIDSHRRLRSLNLEDSNERRAALLEATQHATAAAREHALTHEYISAERLRTLTLAEIAQLLFHPEETP